MDLSKLPPHLLITLGLSSCVLDACLTPDPTELSTSTGPSDDITTGTGTGSDTTSTGPCLGAPMDSTGTDTGTDTGSDATSTGPCLGAPMDSSSSDTGSGTDTDGGTSSGGMLDEPPLPSTRAAAVERVLARGTLPPDVAARLRSKSR